MNEHIWNRPHWKMGYVNTSHNHSIILDSHQSTNCIAQVRVTGKKKKQKKPIEKSHPVSVREMLGECLLRWSEERLHIFICSHLMVCLFFFLFPYVFLYSRYGSLNDLTWRQDWDIGYGSVWRLISKCLIVPK